MSENIVSRFWKKVDVRSPGLCWEWLGATNKDGYGRFKVEGKYRSAHRVCLLFAFGPPKGRLALHHCDNPTCVNYRHLYWGSHSENMQDAWNRGRRNAKGERNPFSKLTRRKVRRIKRLVEEVGYSHRETAEVFGISHSLVTHICNGDRWSHV